MFGLGGIDLLRCCFCSCFCCWLLLLLLQNKYGTCYSLYCTYTTCCCCTI